MWLNLLNNWRLILIAIPSALLLLQVWSWRSEALKVPALNAALNSCESGKQITLEANDALQKSRDVIADKLASSKRMFKTCVPISNSTNTAASGGEYAAKNGLPTSSLLDYAAICETYRQQRVILEKFIADERK